MKFRPRLRSIFLVVNLVILVLPLGGIAILRIYDSALMRQTESELIAQAAFVSAAYKFALRQSFDKISAQSFSNYGIPLESGSVKSQSDSTSTDSWRPIIPKLDFATDHVFPAPEEALSTNTTLPPAVIAAGELINPIMREAQTVTLAGIRIVDVDGIVVATTRSEWGQSIRHRYEVNEALKGNYVSIFRQRISDEPPPSLVSISRGTVVRIFVGIPIIIEDKLVGAAILSRTPRDVTQSLYAKRFVLLKGAIILVLVVVLLTIYTTYTINRPIHKLVVQAQRIIRGEKGSVKKLQKPISLEVDQLSSSIAKMADTLEYRANYFQSFAGHVSHAFKTPLTAIQGAIELLLDHYQTMSDDDRNKFLNNIAQDSARLNELVVRLFDLAKADSIQIENHETDIFKHARIVKDLYNEPAIIIKNNTSTRSVNMEGALLNSIMTTIIDNAKQHEATKVVITIDSLDLNKIQVRFQDNGSGISKSNAKKIFEPFFTTRANKGGTGLGLAVARKLAIAHGGDLALIQNDDDTEKGTVFSLLLEAGKKSES